MAPKNQVDYPIHSGKAPLRTEDGTDFDTIKKRFKSLHPDTVTDAAELYQGASNALAQVTHDLQTRAKQLIAAWGGGAAQKALDQLGQIHWTANELSNKSIATANNLQWYGADVLQWYRDLGDNMSDGAVHSDKDDKQARRLMDRLNLRTSQAQDAFPQKITKNLPDGDTGNLGNPNGPGKGPGIPDGGPRPTGSHLPKSDPFGNHPDNRNPHLPTDHPLQIGPSTLGGGGGESSLAGFDPGGGGAGGGMGGGGLGDSAGLGSGGASGAGGLGAAGLGSSGLGAGANAAGNAMGAAGRGTTPASGGGHGQGEKERERSTWLTEDKDVWGADDDAVPPLIG